MIGWDRIRRFILRAIGVVGEPHPPPVGPGGPEPAREYREDPELRRHAELGYWLLAIAKELEQQLPEAVWLRRFFAAAVDPGPDGARLIEAVRMLEISELEGLFHALTVAETDHQKAGREVAVEVLEALSGMVAEELVDRRRRGRQLSGEPFH